jgi:hypothetical protein
MSRFLGAGFFLLGLALVLVPRFILPTCYYAQEGHGLSRCAYMGWAAMLMGGVVMVLGAVVFFLRGPLRSLMVVAAALAVAVLALPQVMGYCASPHMPCNWGTVPGLRSLGGLMLLASVAGFFLSKERTPPPPARPEA